MAETDNKVGNYSELNWLVNDAVLTRELKRRTVITTLNLTWCTSVTDQGIQAVVRCPKLRIISLRRNRNITDKSLVSLSHHCPKIQSLDLDTCVRLTDRGISALSACDGLQRLRLARCRAITDVSLTSLAKNNSELVSIDLTGVTQITDKGVRALIDGCPQLAEINLTGCPDADGIVAESRAQAREDGSGGGYVLATGRRRTDASGSAVPRRRVRIMINGRASKIVDNPELQRRGISSASDDADTFTVTTADFANYADPRTR